MGAPIILGGGRLLTLAGALAMLGAGSGGGSVPVEPPPQPVPGAAMPTASMSGWWDASALAAGQQYSTLTDKSTAGKNATASGATAFARMAGSLGGLYLEGSPYANPYNYAYMHPIINDYSVGVTGASVGASGALTVFLVWSRANQRQPGAVLSTAAVDLVAINGTTVLSMTGNGDGNDVLKLFPNGAATTAGTLKLRHTHSARLVFAGSTVDVWLDGNKVITAAANSLSLGATANIAFLNAAQCVFHEAAAWSKALSASEHSDLSSYAARWPLGPRRAINGILIGQSNAAKMLGLASNYAVSKKVAYLTGCVSANLMMSSGGNGQIRGAPTIYSGQGLYANDGTLFLTSSGADPSTWPLGNNGNSFMSAVDAMTADQRANTRYIAWFWSETDSAMLAPSMKATYTAAMKRAISLIRAKFGLTAAQLPVMVISALPFSTDAGCQTHREVMADLVADASQNVRLMLAQSGDAIGEGDSWDPATGLESGSGNGAHRDDAGQMAYAYRLGIPIARAVVAANAAASTPDAVTAIDASIPQIGGPKVVSAVAESGTSVLVTVQHDGGTDLAVPLRAAQGVGWTLNGLAIKATACARVSATQLRLTFPSVPAGAKLYYAYGSNLDANVFAVIGRGNAVTDNFGSVTLAAGWRIGQDLGSANQPNNPLQATAYGVNVT